MKVDIYKSVNSPNRFLTVSTGTDIQDLGLSEEDAKHYQQLEPFKKAMTIDASDKRIALDASKIIENIEAHGYALHSILLQFQESK